MSARHTGIAKVQYLHYNSVHCTRVRSDCQIKIIHDSLGFPYTSFINPPSRQKMRLRVFVFLLTS